MTAHVVEVAAPTAPARGIAVVLHGGRATSTDPVRARQLAVLRMRPFAAELRRAGAPDGLVVARLRFAVRGWNGPLQSPVANANAALDDLMRRYPGLPIALVGHSMGARTALYVAGHEAVRAVVGLAPWIEEGDPVQQLAGRHLLLAHGTRDRMTSAKASSRYAAAARGIAASVGYVSVADEAHAMLRRAGTWHRLAAGYTCAVLLGSRPYETDDSATTNVVERALAGEAPIVV